MIDTSPVVLPLSERLRERIRREGPITFCEWMRAALYDPHEGYYKRSDRKRWGREGDYRTSPERSALFAATFAGYFADLFEKLGGPSKWTIVESGAGDGSFANGLLATLQEFFPHVFKATHYVIDEIGAGESTRQRLSSFGDRVTFEPIAAAEINPGIVFSNELFDAFPVHRVTVDNGEVREFYVNLGPNEEFVWALGALSSPELTKHIAERRIELAEGQSTEINLAIEDWLTLASARITRGFLITVDYGVDPQSLRSEGTLRGFQKHSFVADVLSTPGEQDLTSSVDWSVVRDVGDKLGLKTIAFECQDKFLLSAGLLTQLQLEMDQQVDDVERLRLSTAAREMILPDGMAASFQVLVQEKVNETA
ncbi:MAG TPA: SAM-dependent methyltransferase [Pyrinomonadaceae bacterium]|nr:SAM-dependent methyltransferase [Pyrinomonadaceae bacterium]